MEFDVELIVVLRRGRRSKVVRTLHLYKEAELMVISCSEDAVLLVPVQCLLFQTL